jgi:uncharacterized membrane protein YozB (DUF420 family)
VNLSYFPIVNASLNGASAILLLTGFILIKVGKVVAHATMMICAFATSTVFLACYLTYHVLRVQRGVGLTKFPQGSLRPWYLALLGSHTILAVVILPLIALTLWFAWRRNWTSHRRISVWTFPLWFYVSVTGVAVYWMLYHVAPTLK